MSQSNLLALVERLRGAGQMDHLSFCNKYGSRPPWDHCNCIASDHNSAVDAAAKALIAEIKRTEEDFGRCPGCRQPYLTKAKICGNPRCNRDCLHGD